MELHEPYYDGNNSVRDVYQALREYFPHMESYWKQNEYESGYERIYRDDAALGEDMDWGAEALCRWFITHEDPSLAHFFFEKPLIETIKEENGCEP